MIFLHSGSTSVQPVVQKRHRNSRSGKGRRPPRQAGKRTSTAASDDYWLTASWRCRPGLPIGRASPQSGHRRCSTSNVRRTTTASSNPHTRQGGNSRRSGPLRSGFGRMASNSSMPWMVSASFMSSLKCTSRAEASVDSFRTFVEGARRRATACSRDRKESSVRPGKARDVDPATDQRRVAVRGREAS